MSTNIFQPNNNGVLKIISLLTAVFPFSLAAAVFTGTGFYGMLLTAAAFLIFVLKASDKKIMPAFSAFLVILFISQAAGETSVYLAIAVAGAVSGLYFHFSENFKIRNNAVTAGFSLATALTVTVLLTTHYFGIGASGTDVREMIASYLSLGFHPNWRGVLYGTVVMVIMITFPRKFKKFCSVIKAPFIALAVTLILNCFLNPSYMVTAINEIGNFASDSFTPSFALDIFGRIPVHSLAVVMIVGAWESVRWGEIKKAFSSPVSIICFAVTVIATLYFGYICGIIISAILYIIHHFIFSKTKKDKTIS